jgi:hypothetical protein
VDSVMALFRVDYSGKVYRILHHFLTTTGMLFFIFMSQYSAGIIRVAYLIQRPVWLVYR